MGICHKHQGICICDSFCSDRIGLFFENDYTEQKSNKVTYKTQKGGYMNYKLDPYEQEILDAIESGKIKPRKIALSERKRLMEAAENTLSRLRKSESITLRMNKEDLGKLKVAARREGLPYQTLIGSLLHKYVQTAT